MCTKGGAILIFRAPNNSRYASRGAMWSNGRQRLRLGIRQLVPTKNCGPPPMASTYSIQMGLSGSGSTARVAGLGLIRKPPERMKRDLPCRNGRSALAPFLNPWLSAHELGLTRAIFCSCCFFGPTIQGCRLFGRPSRPGAACGKSTGPPSRYYIIQV